VSDSSEEWANYSLNASRLVADIVPAGLGNPFVKRSLKPAEWEALLVSRRLGLQSKMLPTRLLQALPHYSEAKARLNFNITHYPDSQGDSVSIGVSSRVGLGLKTNASFALEDGFPQGDWSDILAMMDEREAIVRHQSWMTDWVRYDTGRSIEILPSREIGSSWAFHSLPGQPAWLVVLQGHEQFGTILLSLDGSQGLITRAYSGRANSVHWFDSLNLAAGECIVVRDGKPIK
jgi:hypothetical protein